MRLLLLQNAEYFFLAHDEEFLAIDLDLSSRILAKQNAVACLNVEREDLAFVIRLTLATGDDFTLLGLFLGGARAEDAPPDRCALFYPTHQNAVVKRGKAGSYGRGCSCHCVTSPCTRVTLALIASASWGLISERYARSVEERLALSLFN